MIMLVNPPPTTKKKKPTFKSFDAVKCFRWCESEQCITLTSLLKSDDVFSSDVRCFFRSKVLFCFQMTCQLRKRLSRWTDGTTTHRLEVWGTWRRKALMFLYDVLDAVNRKTILSHVCKGARLAVSGVLLMRPFFDVRAKLQFGELRERVECVRGGPFSVTAQMTSSPPLNFHLHLLSVSSVLNPVWTNNVCRIIVIWLKHLDVLS